MTDLVQIPWSLKASCEETEYRMHGCVRTVGTRFLTPPSNEKLKLAFETKHPGSDLTVGARALCKHHVRVERHPVWLRPVGTCAQKNALARFHLQTMLDNATWKNVHFLPHQQLVYEIRDDAGYGMRWNLVETASAVLCSFRGYLENHSCKQGSKTS